MSNKIRLIFLIVIFVIFIGSILIFNDFQSPVGSKVEMIPDFKITKISGNGKIYFDKNPIPVESSEFSSAQAVDIKQMHYSGPMYLKTDDQTAFEFYCVGTSFTVLPDSYLYYQPKAKEFYFHTGEFYWNKEVKSKKANGSFYIQEPQNTLILSGSGRIKIQEDSIEIWNYSNGKADDLKFSTGEEDFNVTPRQLLLLKKDKPPVIFDLLPLTESIDPEKTVISLNKPDDSVVRFNWKNVPGAKQYVFRLYSSNLKENILVEKFTQLPWVNLDLLQFEEREFYWQVFPVDIEAKDQLEGMPSQLGHIQLIGALMGKKDVQKPPQLNIKSLTVNGNLVIIKGSADSNAQLYINEELVKIDMDGEFIHYLSFSGLGLRRISFRLVSPLGVETTEERMVTIFAE